MEKEKIQIMVICDDEKHLSELVSAINRRGAQVFNVVSFAKTCNLNGKTERNTGNLQVIVLSCIGKADPPYDLWVLRHRFPCASKIVELDIDTTERAYNITRWGADDIFSKGEDVVDVIIKALKGL